MKTVKEAAPVICERCEKVFYTKYAFICPECRKEQLRELAKSRNLSKICVEARLRKDGADNE